MALYEYSRFKIRIDPGSKKRQGLHAGDVVRRQYADGAQTFYSLMVVLATGEDSVLLSDGIHASSPFFIGALIEGDEPRDGELLDFVRLTSLTDERRSGAMYLTASDEEAPYMDVIDGMGTERSLPRSVAATTGCGPAVTRLRKVPPPASSGLAAPPTRRLSPAVFRFRFHRPFPIPSVW